MTDGAEQVVVGLRVLDPEIPPPRYARPGDAGAALAVAEDCTLAPGERRLVRTGIAVAIPPGWVGLVHPRSGLAARHGLTIVNAPGTVDSGYRGEIMVCLLNTDTSREVRLSKGDLIAQLVLQRVGVATFAVTDELPASARGTGGHGSTGGIRHWEQTQDTQERSK